MGLTDVGGDNRVHLDELAFLNTNYGPLCVLTPGGRLDFLFNVDMTLVSLFSFELIDVEETIYEWEFVTCGCDAGSGADAADACHGADPGHAPLLVHRRQGDRRQGRGGR